MRIRPRYAFIPLLALVGVLLALFLMWRGRHETITPAPAPLPPPAPPAAGSEPSPQGSARPASHPPSAAAADERALIKSEVNGIASNLWMKEKQFFADHGRYTTDLDELGYLPDPGTWHVKAGFLRPFAAKNPLPQERPDFMSFDEYSRDPIYKDIHFAPAAASLRLEDAGRFCRQGCTATEKGFEIALISPIGVWTINEKKELVGFAAE